jgi:hypothetical protein
MVSQLRVYTINRGMMDSWLKLFEEHIRPLHSKLGMPVERTWVNADRTEFLWVRSFKDTAEIPDKEAAYFDSPERTALGDTPQQHIAKIEVRLIEPVLSGSPVA